MPLQLYYVTDRRQFPGEGPEQERRLLLKIAECAAAGVDYIQLREKDLSIRALEELARKAVAALGSSSTRLLINSRTDVALACGAHGVHLPSNDLPASEVRAIFARAGFERINSRAPVIGVSAHSETEIANAEAHGADFAVFGPVFEKGGTANPHGLDRLQQICRRADSSTSNMPVFALGGITLENAHSCVKAGAAGIAGIRLFQENDARGVAEKLRRLQA
jgi:thiamine-phosphate pyrophosphorylase